MLTALMLLLGVVVPFAVLIPFLIKLMAEQKQLRNDYATVWHGIVERGFLEAVKCGYLEWREGRWWASSVAETTYQPIALRLKVLREAMRQNTGAWPSDFQFTWAVEHDRELQDWMLNHGCKSLGVNSHGCLAIACVISRGE